MKKTRVTILLVVIALLLIVPATALATKQIFKAALTPGADGNASGSAVVAITPNGVNYMMSVRDLTEQPWGAHIHKADGSIVATLCGEPAPAGSDCTMDNGILKVFGSLTGPMINMTQAEFLAGLQSGEFYINVHTSAGVEATGVLLPR
ncbi:MAG: CHRD domain-containing protein [Ardenticatenaceae bacterium]|nr:CHRD domain-containing protein [Anaerolineales bacterium]MCB8922874.1 CHRD domain-containing protein [Ardenticatenaceae bacterium]MCB8990388.1 CHRD domain-containing protein [Ardenticatenaceae bacterium]